MAKYQSQPLKNFHRRNEELRGELAGDERDVFDRVIERIDPDRIQELQHYYMHRLNSYSVDDIPRLPYAKYLDVAKYTVDKIKRARSFGLFDVPAKRILDIGSGPGYFSAVCEVLGHNCVALDRSYRVGDTIAKLLEIDRRFWEIEPSKALPDSLGKFDLITAFRIKFDQLAIRDDGTHIYWSHGDWDYWLRDVTQNRLNYPGSIFLWLNKKILPDGSKQQWTDLVDSFVKIGAKVVQGRSEIWLDVNGEMGLIY